jgi:hypothetical protein
MTAVQSIRLAALSAALFTVHCGSDATTPPSGFGTGGFPPTNGGAYGTGGFTTTTGGATSAGGATPGSGGSVTGTGGTTPASGGAISGSGGAIASGGGGNTGGSGNARPVDPVGNEQRAPGFVDLSPPMGAPLPEQGDAVATPPPAGWTWHGIEGAVCRDNSPTGFYVHRGTVDKLLIFLEGGGACSNGPFCNYNPKNVDFILSGGETVLGSALGSVPGRQQPGGYTAGVPSGIFETERAENPFKGWSQVYIPYCTGDVYFGTKKDASVPGSTEKMQFVGHYNMQKFVGRIVPTFKDKVKQVIIAGSSAGGFGALLNFSMVQDAFGNVPVSVLDDAGPPFEDAQMPVCMQKRWREAWGFENSLPPDCAECRRADGGGMLRYADFAIKKHPKAKLAVISAMQDEVIRLFYSVGLKDCASYNSADPVAITLGQIDPAVYYPAPQYEAGLNGLRTNYASTNRLATYYMPGSLHQHLFRARLYEAPGGGVVLAKFVQDFIDGKATTVGP